MYRFFFKRVIDLFLAFFLVLATSPVLITVALLLFILNRGSIFFVQERPGLNEKGFKLIKFKSMMDWRDVNGNLLPDNIRLTSFGKLIRRYSIDELPQLINVLKGDMSLIGPRPLLFKYLPLYTDEQRKRHQVRPGITGWAQVNGRNSISWTRKFALDVYYVENLSLWMDVRIVFLTIKKVFNTEGVNESDKRPMTPFNGTN